MKYENGVATLHPFSGGMNNRAQEARLPEGFVRNAVNADFVGESLRRRKGLTKVLSCVNSKAGFSCPLGRFFVEGPFLKKFNANNTATTLYAGITGTHCTYDYFNDVLYFSDGVVNLKITASGVTKWGIEPPAAPAISNVSGTYTAGVYQAACCFVDAAGVESGASSVVSITVNDNSGFVFTLPTITDPQVEAVRIYLSTANGSELYHVADTILSSYPITAGRYDEGTTLETQLISPPPTGIRIIRHYNGRSYVADSHGRVWYSEPYSFDQFKLGDNYIQVTDPVAIMEPVKNGIFFAYGNRTEFWAGNPEDGFEVIPKFEYGGVLGTGGPIPNSDNVAWQSQRGMVVGTPDGNCKNIQEENVAVESAVSGATLVREKDGIRQFIASLHQPTTSTMAASSWVDAEVIRRGA